MCVFAALPQIRLRDLLRDANETRHYIMESFPLVPDMVEALLDSRVDIAKVSWYHGSPHLVLSFLL